MLAYRTVQEKSEEHLESYMRTLNEKKIAQRNINFQKQQEIHCADQMGKETTGYKKDEDKQAGKDSSEGTK